MVLVVEGGAGATGSEAFGPQIASKQAYHSFPSPWEWVTWGYSAALLLHPSLRASSLRSGRGWRLRIRALRVQALQF